ncbi:UDP-galactopyranose mutase [Megasphaera paucivorans]|uniref:UDP-galactopyranose mutase n=1 Tax=Megasphaera paucivorans TaxID=349095 RepID=A0A1G9PV36_9FIRM|nr:UDP-galactopyranose mutase [Megasphaera paucivorans]SDM02619.1 UDP-galactopyranose mutase [Megasphaera paucivorans]
MYDYLIVGSGLFGCVLAHEIKKHGKSCLIIERRNHVGGNLYCEEKEGIHIHKYGAHIFHTSNKIVWNYVNQFVEFNNYINSPVANYKGELYNLPFNMNTFYKLWGNVTPKEAEKKINAQRTVIHGEPKNLEEQAISLVGTDIYMKLIKEYTEKQWGRSCKELPAFIIKRLPVRYTFDNNYFNDRYQGIPVGGYNKLIYALLDGIEVHTGVDYNIYRNEYKNMAPMIIYTGPIDSYYNYQLGNLEYRSLAFKTERFEEVNHQGVAVMNYTAWDVPYTRSIEHKHFEFGKQPVTYVTKEYSTEWVPGEEAYYPVNDMKNSQLYARYRTLAEKERNVLFGGRLAEYTYYDMDEVIEQVLSLVNKIL